jgi:O-antigen/teichoic acid export membrane protein
MEVDRDAVTSQADDDRPETELQRSDRNFTELLQELRVAQTGVQILFGFLLTVPFSNRFAEHATRLQTVVYVLTMLACAAAVALIIAPVSLHRRVFRQGRKPELVRWANRLAQAGLFSLLLAMAGVVFLLLDVLEGAVLAVLLTIVVATVYVVLWYRLPRESGLRPEESPSRK